jgi:hypothetical protein
MADDIATSSPSEFADSIKRLQDSLTHPNAEKGLTPIRFIVRRLEKEAFEILRKAGLLKVIDDLWLLDDEEYEGDVRIDSAKDVLFRAASMREYLELGRIDDALLDILRLTASAIRMENYEETLHGRYSAATQVIRGRMQGENQADARKKEWAKLQNEADQIWKEHPTWGIEHVAKKIQKKFPDETVRTIRLRIKKPSM